MFFDRDGKCYYIGTRPNREGCKYNGDWYIWVQELDLSEWKLVGEAKDLWNGSQKKVIWPEGPHLYYKDGYYYIMHAEGGTGPWHAVAVCRSRNLWGPYENNPCNPILTHRHLGKDYPIKYVGHGDLVRTVNGEWYMVMLAVRPLEGYTTMGRETFLARVTWEEDWPIVNPGAGMLTEEVEIDLPEWNPDEDPSSYRSRSAGKNALPGSSRIYDFTATEQLGDEFLLLRNPDEDMYRLEKGKGLYLRFGKDTLSGHGSPSFVAVRQQHHSFLAIAVLDGGSLASSGSAEAAGCVTENPAAYDPAVPGSEASNSAASDPAISGSAASDLAASSACTAGLVLLQNNLYHLRLEVSAREARVILCEKGEEQCLGTSALPEGALTPLPKGMEAASPEDAVTASERTGIAASEFPSAALTLYLKVEGLKAQMGWILQGEMRPIAEDIDIRRLSTEVSGGFVGCTVGMYAEGPAESGAGCLSENGRECQSAAFCRAEGAVPAAYARFTRFAYEAL